MKVVMLRPISYAKRWSMDLYTTQLQRSLQKLSPQDQFEIFPAPSFSLPANSPWKLYYEHYWSYGQKIRKLEADVFHITDHGYLNLIPFLPHRRFVISWHDMLLNRLHENSLPVRWKPHFTIWAQLFSQRHLPSAPRIITGSAFIQNEISRKFPHLKDRVRMIPDGITENYFESVPEVRRAAFRIKWGIANRPVLLLPGRSDPHKNIEGALQVVKILREIFKLPCVLIKTGSPLTVSQRRLVDHLKIKPSVIETGPLESEELRTAYAASSALIFLSWYEGFGLPVLEAMAAGVPVVSSFCASLPEIAGKAAILVDPRLPEDVAQSVSSVLTDLKVRQEAIDNGRKRAAEFPWSKTASLTFDIYLELNQKKKGA